MSRTGKGIKRVDYRVIEKYVLQTAAYEMRSGGIREDKDAPSTTEGYQALDKVREWYVEWEWFSPAPVELMTQSLLEKRLIVSEGITPDGLARLYELEHPVRHWLQQYWFPATIAAATLLFSASAVVLDITRFLTNG